MKETHTLEIPQLSAEMEKLLDRTLTDFMSLLGNISGNLKDISDGTQAMLYIHKNPAGCWICEVIQAGEQAHLELMALERAIREFEGLSDDTRFKLLTEKVELNNPKSDEL